MSSPLAPPTSTTQVTVYEKTPNDLYATGQRTVSTFPSGLIRVDQTFVCKTSAADSKRATLSVGSDFPSGSEPSLDGLKIFPEVQERRRDDGFTEFIVSAYGRSTNSDRITKTKKINSIFGLRYSSESYVVEYTRIDSEPLKEYQFPANCDFFESEKIKYTIRKYENQTITVQLSPTTKQIFTSPLMFVAYKNGIYYLFGGTGETLLNENKERNFGMFNESQNTYEMENLSLLFAKTTDFDV